MNNNAIVELTLRKHKISIENEVSVKVVHPKDCKKPCKKLNLIINYLSDELFISEDKPVEIKDSYFS